ncbi:MAG: hypothetical protein P4L40_12800 [Terracidiphilus sp.]|nr:hypothetical protein [Terracidiphilus sp.]
MCLWLTLYARVCGVSLCVRACLHPSVCVCVCVCPCVCVHVLVCACMPCLRA